MEKNQAAGNDYEEIRKQRLEENKKRLEDLGIAKISGNLLEFYKSKKKIQHRPPKLRKKIVYTIEPRRSSRFRNEVPSYREDIEVDIPAKEKRSRPTSIAWASYAVRPIHECRTASFEERAEAIKVAEEFLSNLRSGNPCFVKSMLRSHVYSCFWLGLPSSFCAGHLSKETYEIVLEDEEGQEYHSTFIGKRTGLSGGWRGFALDHELDDGDALVFELTEPTRFKVYIFRVSSLENQQKPDVRHPKDSEENNSGATCSTRNRRVKSKQIKDEEPRWRKKMEAAADKMSRRSKTRRKA